jgi:hypothetical protein
VPIFEKRKNDLILKSYKDVEAFQLKNEAFARSYLW